MISETINQQPAKVMSGALRTEFLESLRFREMNERKNDINPWHPRSYSWLFDKPTGKDAVWFDRYYAASWDDFSDWLRSVNTCYCISGKPGSGKSTLMSFLLKNPSTQSILRDSIPKGKRVQIISHFFLLSGSRLQCTVKGLLFTLLYQLLSEDDTILSDLLSDPNGGFEAKQTTSDWSEQELQTLLTHTLSKSSAAVCIFIDGLDEVSPNDGTFKLLQVLEHIRSFPRVKMCVSSRQEEAFRAAFAHTPCLQLHQLTTGDIYRYATTQLEAQLERPATMDRHGDAGRLADKIALQLEGVFLWALLERRLGDLPSDLNRLYADMWDRLNDDKSIYREEAAFLLNLALESLPPSPETWEGLGYTWGTALVAYENQDIAELLKIKSETDLDDFDTRVYKFQKLVAVRCAGLLETEDKGNRAPYSFIHRCVREFLVSSSDGKDILKADRTSSAERKYRLLKGTLCMFTLYVPLPLGGNYHHDSLINCCHLPLTLEPEESTPFPLALLHLCSQDQLVFKHNGPIVVPIPWRKGKPLTLPTIIFFTQI